MTTLPEAVNQMIEVIAILRRLVDELGDWAAEANGSGDYPFTQPDGTVIMMPSTRKLAQQIATKYDALFAAGTAQQAEVKASLATTTNGLNQIRAWLTGTRFGGLFGDGRFPITLANGTTVYVASPDRIQMLAVAAVDPSQLDDEIWSQIQAAQDAAETAIEQAAQVLGARLTIGERYAAAAFLGEGVNGGTVIKDGTRNVGYTIPAQQLGGNSYVVPRIPLTAEQAASLAGQTVTVRTVAQVSVNFTTLKPLLATPARVDWADGTTTNVGTLTRSEQVGDRLYREVTIVIDQAMRRIGTMLQVAGSAVARADDHSLRVLSTTILIETPPGAIVGGADTALKFLLDERAAPVDRHLAELDQAFVGLGNLIADAAPFMTGANGGTVNAWTLTVPVGASGYGSVAGASLPFDGAANAGRKIRIRLGCTVSATFTRLTTLSTFIQVNLSAGGFENRQITATMTGTGTRRVFTFDYDVRGDETTVKPFIQPLTSAVTTVEETITPTAVSIQYLTAISDVLTAADEALAAYLAKNIRIGLGIDLADGDTSSTAGANGSTVITASLTGQKIGLAFPQGTAGNGSQFYCQLSIDGSRNVGKRIRMTMLFDVSTPFTRNSMFMPFQVRTATAIQNRAAAINRFSTPAPGKRQWTMEYIVQGDEIALRAAFVTFNTDPVPTAESIIARDFAVEWLTTNVEGEALLNTNLKGFKALALAQAAATAAQIAAGGASTVKTLKPSGGDFSTPTAAMLALGDATAGNRYTLKVSEGIYTDREWRPRDYVDVVGYDRDRTIFDGSLPNDATAAQIEATSTMWLDRQSRLEGITVRGRNVRYALHAESNGALPNRTLEIVNCDFEHLGNDGAANNQWQSQFGVGSGLSSGVKLLVKGSRFAGTQGGFSYHTNLDWSDPSFVDFDGCSMIGTKEAAFALRVLPIGSGVADKCRVVGCELVGDIVYGPSPWMPTTLAKQPANHSEVDMWGYGNSPAVFRSIDFGQALVIESATIGAASAIIVGGDAAPWLFGDGQTLKLDANFSRTGSPGFRARAVGWGDVSGIAVGPTISTVITRLGQRLGDCRGMAKTLTVSVNGAGAQSISFTEDFRSQTNQYVIDYINARLSGASASLLGTGALYRPRFTDEEFEALNLTGSAIYRGSALAFDQSGNRVRVMTSNDPARLFAGVAMFDIETGRSGRVKKAGYMPISDIMRGDNATFVSGDVFSISAATPGAIVKGGAQGMLMAIRANAVRIR